MRHNPVEALAIVNPGISSRHYTKREISQGRSELLAARRESFIPGLPGHPWVVLGDEHEVLSYHKTREKAQKHAEILSKIAPKKSFNVLYLMDLFGDPRGKDIANVQRIMGAYVVVDEKGDLVRRHLSEQAGWEWVADAERKHPGKRYTLILDMEGFDPVEIDRKRLKAAAHIRNVRKGAGLDMSRNSLGESFVSAIDYAKENPFLIILGGLGAAVSIYFVYRIIRLLPKGGILQWNGYRYRITPEDRLWMGRMLIGEVGETGWEGRAKDEAAAAVLWSVATRHMSKRKFRESGSFMKTMRMFSQPINPIWSSASACSPEGIGCCNRGSSMCSQDRLDRRARIQRKSWNELPARVRELVDLFVSGQLENPIPGYNDFAGARHISDSAINTSRKPAITIGGNTFISRPSFEEGALRIV